MADQTIRTAQSRAVEARQAVQEFHAAVAQPDMELVIFFCSSLYDLDALSDEMNRLFSGTQVVGCTSAGEIGPEGYLTHSLSGASFAAQGCTAVSGLLEELSRFDMSQGHDFTQTLLQRLESKVPQATADNSFAMLLIDGLSRREEQVAHVLQFALGGITLFGGSAGDDRKYAKTLVYSDGRFHSNSAALILVNTALPFKVFMTHHFVATNERLVVTQADIASRTVMEINGLPAAAEYARLIGIDVDHLGAKAFAASPLVVVIGGTDYVRAIQKTNPDGSLTFFCAIDEGVVLRVAHGINLLDNLKQALKDIRTEIGQPQLVIGCDCILRDEEFLQNGQKPFVDEILQANNAVGFNSYGEQYRGIHVNQTFTGIAIGAAAAGDGK
ncbi:MAG: nitric oxide-sensing protein NosP [Sideroxyarcus sp.]